MPATGTLIRAANAADNVVDAAKVVENGASATKGASGGQRAGKPFTPKGKAQAKAQNAEANEGQTTCVGCGQKTIPGQQSKRGVKRPGNETNVDHIIPKAKGGDGSPDNGQVLCLTCKIKKGDRQ